MIQKEPKILGFLKKVKDLMPEKAGAIANIAIKAAVPERIREAIGVKREGCFTLDRRPG